MKKLLLSTSLVLTGLLTSAQSGFYLNGSIGVTDTSYSFGYVFYPTKPAPLIAKDSTSLKISFLRTQFTQLNSSKNDGTPNSIFWGDNDGYIKARLMVQILVH